MRILQRSENETKSDEFVVVGVGGAGSRFTSEISQILPPGGETISVDRSAEDLSGIRLGKRIAIGYPMFGIRAANEERFDSELVDESDLYRLKAGIGKPSQVFVVGGLGGEATNELMPTVVRTAMARSESVLVIVTLPFTFEGRARRELATRALERVRATGCPIAVIDADRALSNSTQIGSVCDELSAVQARALMTVLTSTGVGSSDSLSNSSEMLECLSGARDAFVAHASTQEFNSFRKATREAINRPLTTGIELCKAQRVGVVVAGPADLPMKVLNSTISIVEKELGHGASLTTSFVAIPDSDARSKFRISILGGGDASGGTGNVSAEELSAVVDTPQPSATTIGEEIAVELHVMPLLFEDSKNGVSNGTMSPALL